MAILGYTQFLDLATSKGHIRHPIIGNAIHWDARYLRTTGGTAQLLSSTFWNCNWLYLVRDFLAIGAYIFVVFVSVISKNLLPYAHHHFLPSRHLFLWVVFVQAEGLLSKAGDDWRSWAGFSDEASTGDKMGGGTALMQGPKNHGSFSGEHHWNRLVTWDVTLWSTSITIENGHL